MTVKIRPYRKGGWEIDILIRLDDGRKYRERRKSPVESRSGSLRWGQDRERHLLRHGPGDSDRDKIERAVPTLAEFAPRYMEGYAKARRLKPSSMHQKQVILRRHLLPVLGDVGLDEIGEEHVGKLRAVRSELAANTVNKIVGTLLHMLKMAVRWKVCPPKEIHHDRLRESTPEIEFYEFEALERLVAAARAAGSNHLLVVLLAGDAGLRRGEIIALEWDHVDLRRGLITICQSDWEGQVGDTKGGRSRTVPMTSRLREALASARHLIGPRVLYRVSAGQHSPVKAVTIRTWLGTAQRKAGLPKKGPHTLRHTFCSHLAMRGVPARTIQELAGHKDLSTTQRYMHLAPGALTDAIATLEAGRGDMMETPVQADKR